MMFMIVPTGLLLKIPFEKQQCSISRDRLCLFKQPQLVFNSHRSLKKSRLVSRRAEILCWWEIQSVWGQSFLKSVQMWVTLMRVTSFVRNLWNVCNKMAFKDFSHLIWGWTYLHPTLFFFRKDEAASQRGRIHLGVRHHRWAKAGLIFTNLAKQLANS